VRILETMAGHPPQSIKEVAHNIRRPPAALYHHFKILVRAGLVLAVGVRGTGRKRERLYRAAASAFRARIDQRSKADRTELARVGEAHTRYALRRFSRALKAGRATLEGAARNSVVRHMTLRLTPRRLALLNRDLDRLVAKWAHVRAAGGTTALSVLLLMGRELE
jgi:hypothetical protein